MFIPLNIDIKTITLDCEAILKDMMHLESHRLYMLPKLILPNEYMFMIRKGRLVIDNPAIQVYSIEPWKYKHPIRFWERENNIESYIPVISTNTVTGEIIGRHYETVVVESRNYIVQVQLMFRAFNAEFINTINEYNEMIRIHNLNNNIQTAGQISKLDEKRSSNVDKIMEKLRL